MKICVMKSALVAILLSGMIPNYVIDARIIPTIIHKRDQTQETNGDKLYGHVTDIEKYDTVMTSSKQSDGDFESNDDVDKLIDMLLANIEGPSTVPYNEEGESVAEESGRNRSIRRRQAPACREPSDSDLQKQLWKDIIADSNTGHSLNNTDLEVLEPGDCETPVPDTLNRKALCPWTLKDKTRNDKYPRQITYTACESTCTQCPGGLCHPLMDTRFVLLRDNTCTDSVYRYTLKTEKIPYGCYCKNTTQSNVN